MAKSHWMLRLTSVVEWISGKFASCDTNRQRIENLFIQIGLYVLLKAQKLKMIIIILKP